MFLLSAALCLWIAGGQPDAWFKFWMIVGGLALYGILVHLRTAPGQQATRQLLEGTAIAGDVTQASALWRTVDVSRQQLVLRQWWYVHLGEKQSAEWIKQAAQVLH